MADFVWGFGSLWFSEETDLLIRMREHEQKSKPNKHKPELFLQASPSWGLARAHAPGGDPRPLAVRAHEPLRPHIRGARRAPTRFTSGEGV